MEEIWKDIPGYPKYQVSSLGRVKSFMRYKNGKHLSPGTITSGYKQVSLFKDGKKIAIRVHTLVAIAFLDFVPNGQVIVINHINFNKTDNRLENLEVVTNRENINKRNILPISKYSGVCLDKNTGKWSSRITIDGKRIRLGTFEDEKEASIYYENALKAFTDGKSIVIKRRNTTSKHIGISWNNYYNKWVAEIQSNRKRYFIGRFSDENDAVNARNEFIKNNLKTH